MYPYYLILIKRYGKEKKVFGILLNTKADLIDTIMMYRTSEIEGIDKRMLIRIYKNLNYLISGEILNYAGENSFSSHRRGYIGYWFLEFRI